MTFFDLTQPIDEQSVGYPDDPEVSVTKHTSLSGAGYRSMAITMGTHSGTHIDVPAHTEPDGRTIDEYDMSAFRFETVRLDLRDVAPREPIAISKLQDAAAAIDPAAVFEADMVVLWTGWPEHREVAWYREHPYLTAEAAQWMSRNGYHVGVDALSIDPTPTQNARPDEPSGLPAHHELLGEGQIIVENLGNLGAPSEHFRLMVYPLALEDAEAAPTRAIAKDID